MDYNSVLILVIAAAFIYYGTLCLVLPKMVAEFNRFGLSAYRRMTGILQLLGAIGLIVGLLVSPIIGFLAALGLCILMLLGFGVRIKIKDSIGEVMPSFVLMIINAYLVIVFYGFYQATTL
jgi:hypothetical protein